MLRQPVKEGLPKHPVSPKGVLQVLLRLAQRQQNDYFYYDVFKVSKMTIFNYNLFKVSKMTVSDSSVKWSTPGNLLKARFIIFRCQKYVKKGT